MHHNIIEYYTLEKSCNVKINQGVSDATSRIYFINCSFNYKNLNSEISNAFIKQQEIIKEK